MPGAPDTPLTRYPLPPRHTPIGRATKLAHWRRWAGEAATFIRAARVCENELPRWPNAEKVETEATVKRADLVKSYEDVQDLAALTMHEWRKLNEVEVWVRIQRPFENRGFARLVLSSEGISLSVQGGSETAVLGLVAAVHEILDHGLQRPKWLKRNYVVFATCFLIVPATFLAQLPRAWDAKGYAKDGHWSSQELLTLVTAPVAIVLIGAALAYLTPPVEVLPPGSRPRLRRFGYGLCILVLVPLAVQLIGSTALG